MIFGKAPRVQSAGEPCYPGENASIDLSRGSSRWSIRPFFPFCLMIAFLSRAVPCSRPGVKCISFLDFLRQPSNPPVSFLSHSHSLDSPAVERNNIMQVFGYRMSCPCGDLFCLNPPPFHHFIASSRLFFTLTTQPSCPPAPL